MHLFAGALALGGELFRKYSVQLLRCHRMATGNVGELKSQSATIDRDAQARWTWRQAQHTPQLLLGEVIETTANSKQHATAFIHDESGW
jgi:hypothetical protein